jgi:hypothetical protein
MKKLSTPKCKFFVWFIFQDRVWTADCLQKRRWPNCGRRKLCNREDETAVHLLFKCRYPILIWSITSWLGFSLVDMAMCGQTMTRLSGGSR